MFRVVLKTCQSSYTAVIPGQSLGGPGIRAARRLLTAGRVSHVVVLERSWDAVDLTRLLLAASADERISVRHVAAGPLLSRLHRPRHVA